MGTIKVARSYTAAETENSSGANAEDRELGLLELAGLEEPQSIVGSKVPTAAAGAW